MTMSREPPTGAPVTTPAFSHHLGRSGVTAYTAVSDQPRMHACKHSTNIHMYYTLMCSCDTCALPLVDDMSSDAGIHKSCLPISASSGSYFTQDTHGHNAQRCCAAGTASMQMARQTRRRRTAMGMAAMLPQLLPAEALGWPKKLTLWL